MSGARPHISLLGEDNTSVSDLTASQSAAGDFKKWKGEQEGGDTAKVERKWDLGGRSGGPGENVCNGLIVQWMIFRGLWERSEDFASHRE